jgi:molybdenum cofactor cytidylyltransferase
MNLAQVFNLQADTRLAFVGAGGKSSAMFQLAKQAGGRVIVTASAHLAAWQLKEADRHITVNTAEDLASLQGDLPEGVTLLIGPVAQESERFEGLSPELLQQVDELAGRHQVPLLIEADGSRQRPLKAPAEHEPAIPPFVNIVVVVAGINGIGQPLSEEWVHRPELFGKLARLALGDVITKEAFIKVMNHPQGGMKNIPAQAHRLVMLTHVDTPKLSGLANGMCRQLISSYDGLVITNLLNRPNEQVISVHRCVAGVVLAAGASERFGQPKQLLHWRGEPFVRVVARTALQAQLQPVIVVTGNYEQEVKQALEGLDVQVVHNPAWTEGQSASVKAGLAVVPQRVGGAMFLMADQPQIPVDLIQSLRELHANTLAPIVAPVVEGRRGNPVLFDRRTFPDLAQITGDQGGRQLFSKYRATWLPWVDAAIGLDVDTPDDYIKLLKSG